MPGFSAEASLYRTKGPYQSAVWQSYGTGRKGVISQMSASGLGGAAGPFSGSCGCGPGYCCCIFCYFYSCYFWCWETGSLRFWL